MSRHHLHRIGAEPSFSDDRHDGARGDGSRRPIRSPSVVSISVIEGRGIWLVLEGSLVAGWSDRAQERLVRLGELGFADVVVDVSALTEIDATGCEIFERFVSQVADGDGTIRVADPGQVLRAVRSHDAMSVTTSAPDPI